MFEIEGQLIEVGTLWDGDTRIVVEVSDPKGEKQTINFPCTKEQAIEMGKQLYQPVTIKISPKSFDDK